jgi:hypothetical protein
MPNVMVINAGITRFLLRVILEGLSVPNIEVTGRAKRFWETRKAYVARSRAAHG